MADIEPNSHKYKEEQAKKQERKVQAVTKAVVKKKSKARKLLDAFIPENVEDVGTYLITGVLVPTIKRMAYQAFGTVLFGKNGYSEIGRVGYPDRVSYTRFFDDGRNPRRRDNLYPSTSGRIYDWQELLYNTPEDADDVLSRLEDDVRQGYTPSVQDLYEYSGLSAPWSANGYGWTNLRNARIVAIGDKWAIQMPRPLPID